MANQWTVAGLMKCSQRRTDRVYSQHLIGDCNDISIWSGSGHSPDQCTDWIFMQLMINHAHPTLTETCKCVVLMNMPSKPVDDLKKGMV